MWNPIWIIRSIWNQRELIDQLTKRDIVGRYKGSYLGILWSFFYPLLMLGVYTFVFGTIFKSKWAGSNNKAEFPLVLFCGIMTFNIFSEVITRAPSLIINNVNYVKKVVFPLEILPVVAIFSSLINMLISFGILQVGLILFMGVFNWTLIYLPIVLIPYLLLVIGLGWFFAALGVYFRDIGQMLGIAVQALMFLSPIFYPLSSIPPNLQPLYLYNPLTYIVENMRNVIILGQLPNWHWLAQGFLMGFLSAYIGYIWFQRTRGGFADVL